MRVGFRWKTRAGRVPPDVRARACTRERITRRVVYERRYGAAHMNFSSAGDAGRDHSRAFYDLFIWSAALAVLFLVVQRLLFALASLSSLSVFLTVSLDL